MELLLRVHKDHIDLNTLIKDYYPYFPIQANFGDAAVEQLRMGNGHEIGSAVFYDRNKHQAGVLSKNARLLIGLEYEQENCQQMIVQYQGPRRSLMRGATAPAFNYIKDALVTPEGYNRVRYNLFKYINDEQALHRLQWWEQSKPVSIDYIVGILHWYNVAKIYLQWSEQDDCARYDEWTTALIPSVFYIREHDPLAQLWSPSDTPTKFHTPAQYLNSLGKFSAVSGMLWGIAKEPDATINHLANYFLDRFEAGVMDEFKARDVAYQLITHDSIATLIDRLHQSDDALLFELNSIPVTMRFTY